MYLRINLFLTACLIVLAGCDDHKLKQPREEPSAPTSGDSPSSGGTIDREFARELAREFGREFAREFARQLAEGNQSIAVPPVDPTVSEDAVVEKGEFVDANGKPHPLLAHCSEDVLEFYSKHPDAFSIESPSAIPSDLEWEDGSDEPEFASPKAKKGGTWNVFMGDFPRTLRTVGPDANGAFRSYLLDYNALSLVMPHPNSDGYFPGLAKSWAVGKDGEDRLLPSRSRRPLQ